MDSRTLWMIFGPRVAILISLLAIAAAGMIHFYNQGWKHGFEDATEAKIYLEGAGRNDEG